MKNHNRRPHVRTSSRSGSSEIVVRAANAQFENLERRVLLSADYVSANSLAEPYAPQSTFVYNPGGFLTEASRARPTNIALDYLRSNAAAFGLEAGDLEQPFITSQYKDSQTGITHVYLMQEFNGLGVTNARINIAVMPNGSLLSISGGFLPGLGAAERNAPAPIPQIDPRQALTRIADDIQIQVNNSIGITDRTSRLDKRQTVLASDFSAAPIPASLEYVAMPDGSAQLGWKLILDVPGRNNWYELTVDSSTGQILRAHDYYDHFIEPGSELEAQVNSGALFGRDTQSTFTGSGTSTSGTLQSGEGTPDGTYNVLAAPVGHPFDPSPGSAPNRSLVVGGHDTLGSPFGWHDTNGVVGNETTETSGNNVVAQEDANANNGTGLRAQGGPTLNFDFPLDLSLAPLGYQNASLTNLFYWNNLIHDVFYRYGFTEAAGNFQVNNYGRGGAQNDPVLADGQDGNGVNNANFATPVDGSSGRMQMYLWNSTTPQRDGSLDNMIIVHEFGHGIAKRMTGGPSNVSVLTNSQPGGMGEGWGDFFGLMFMQKSSDLPADRRGLATYVLGQANDGQGIRIFPYSTDMQNHNPLTIESFGSGSITYPGFPAVTKSTAVHRTGTVWASILWDMNWNLVDKHGFSDNLAAGYDPSTGNDKGNQLAMRLVVDALKLQPNQPTFMQARDAILAADVALTGGVNQIEIWRAFARRGLGINASTPGPTSSTVIADFTVPIADPYVTTHTPTGTQMAPVESMSFQFNQAMDQTSFSVADDVSAFTGPGGADMKPSITGYEWTNATTLKVDFASTTARGLYSMTIGPNILALDDGNAMDGNGNGTPGEPDDNYTGTFSYQTFLGPEGFGYKAAEFPFESGIDLVIGDPGVNVLVNGSDDGSGSIALPGGTTFNYYGTNHTTIFANANGLITMASGTTAFTNGNLTTSPTQASIAPLWDDWRTDLNVAGATDSAVLWRLDGDRLILEWSDVPNRSAGDGAVTFQAILQLNTGATPGRIIFNYPDITTSNPTYSGGNSATVGIKNSGTQTTDATSNRILVAQNTNANPWVQEGKAVLIATDVEGPLVTQSQFTYLTSQSVNFTFDSDVSASLDAADLVLFNNTTSTAIDPANFAVAWDSGTSTATFTFPGLANPYLPDGNYTATLLSSGITDESGNFLDGNDDGVIGGDYSFNFAFLNGDANADGTVNLADFNIVAANFGQSPRDFSQGDFNYDGIVNLADFNILAAKFGSSLSAGDANTSGSLAGGESRLVAPPMPATTRMDAPATRGSLFGDSPIVELIGESEDLVGLA